MAIEALAISEATKSASGNDLTLSTYSHVSGLFSSCGSFWLTDNLILRDWLGLLEASNLVKGLVVTKVTSFLLDEAGGPEHRK